MTDDTTKRDQDTTSAEPPSSVPQPRTRLLEGRPPENAQEVALDRLFEHVTPLAEMYFDAQVRVRESDGMEHERELAYDSKLLEHETRRHLASVISASGVVIVILAFAGFLVWRGREAVAVDIIKLLVLIAGSAFGGWGIAASRRPREKHDD